MDITPDVTDKLWGEGEKPYSQVQVIKEIRILADAVTRTFYYVKANVNPTTHAVLRELATEIDDAEIQAFLRGASFVSDDDGYEWLVYGKEVLTPRGANQAAEEVTGAVLRMHGLVMDALEKARRRQGEASEAGDDPPPDLPLEGRADA
jgi:hypothetical protein